MPVILEPERRAQAIAKRDRLLNELSQILALSDDERRQQSRINRLQINHGREEVERLLLYMTELLNADSEDLDAFHYQRYHETYRHFGGDRPALDVDQWQALNDEWTGLHIRVVSAAHLNGPVGDSPLSPKEQKRYQQLKDTLLNDSFLWDDITPQEPGQHSLPSLRVMMRQFRKRRATEERSISTQPRAPMHLAAAPQCPTHHLPILRLDGKDQCVHEYLVDCLLGKKISDVVSQGNTAYYIFEDGHRLPLLCGCCGNSLVPASFVASRSDMVGRPLVALTTEHSHDRNGHGYDELILNFGGTTKSASPFAAGVAFTAVAGIKHPPGCRHG